ncbi:MAG: tRNA (adenosine(37)-N6)-dimethylallyltransferase MiaA [Ignavibacteria bacterium GWF2_33_9]|nr:MAG: tRNA (adenosine(37)-N6)-dimethylallyltransferase MiaA [Ignavibacteria bacterium GWF2_33_9]
MGKLNLSEFKVKYPLVVICGPTASGKTNFSYRFYDEIDSEIISADSRQIYKYLNIGTAKPSIEELQKYQYHLIDFLELTDEFSAGKFVELAEEKIDVIYSKNKIPLIVGGTGFYISALCEGLMKTESDHIYYDKVTYEEVRQLDKEEMYLMLNRIDPESAKIYSDKNPRRLIRALEFYYKTGTKISEARKKTINTIYTPIYFAIDLPREVLYRNINNRCLQMIGDGLIDEVKSVLEMGYNKNLNSLNTVGYKEIFLYLDNKISLDAAVNEMQKNTRRYAKRQLTWFKRNENIHWIEGNTLDKTNISELLKKYLK